MVKVTVGKHVYRIGKMDCFQQFAVARRIGPVLVSVGIPLMALRAGIEVDLSDFVPFLEPVTDFMSKMKDEDVNYILMACLSVVSREQGDVVAPVVARGAMMFEDINMPDMIRLVLETIKDNLGDFLPAPVDEKNSTGA